MKYYIGIDSGGTKTDAVLTSADGCVLIRLRDSGCNPNDTGKESARAKLLGIILNLTKKSPERVSSVFAGVAGMIGFGNDFTEFLRASTGISAVRAETDALPLITGTLYRADGACVISGTGSACFVRRGDVLTRIGGWGFMLDSGGSGYDLGRDAIAAALREYDGQGGKTALTGILTKRMGAHPKDMIPDIYRGGRAYVASFADTVFEGFHSGDSISHDIIKRNAEYIVRLINTASRLFEGSFTVVLGGGVLLNYPEFRETIRMLVPEHISLVPAEMPPVYGSVIEAIYSDHEDLPSGFRDNFARSYNFLKSDCTPSS